MKKRLTPILTISLAIVLIGSIAYAADRKKQAKRVDQDRIHEEEALRAELLDDVQDRDKKSREAGDTGKVADPGRKSDQLKSKK
jgi:hypothetical protein